MSRDMTFTNTTFRTLQIYTLIIEVTIETIGVVQCEVATIIDHLIEEVEEEALTTLEIAIIHLESETRSSRGQIDTIRVMVAIITSQDLFTARILIITIITSRIDFQAT